MVIDCEAAPALEALSPAERETIRLLLTGRTNKSVARELAMSVRSIERHRSRALRKLRVGSLVEVARLGAFKGRHTRHLGEAIGRSEASPREPFRPSMFEAAFRAAAVGMAIASPDGRFLAVNEPFCELVGRKERELVAMDIPSVTLPEDRGVDGRRNRRLFAGTSPAIRTAKRYLRPDGVVVRAHLTAGIVRGIDGSVMFAVGSVIPE